MIISHVSICLYYEIMNDRRNLTEGNMQPINKDSNNIPQGF